MFVLRGESPSNGAVKGYIGIYFEKTYDVYSATIWLHAR